VGPILLGLLKTWFTRGGRDASRVLADRLLELDGGTVATTLWRFRNSELRRQRKKYRTTEDLLARDVIESLKST